MAQGPMQVIFTDFKTLLGGSKGLCNPKGPRTEIIDIWGLGSKDPNIGI